MAMTFWVAARPSMVDGDVIDWARRFDGAHLSTSGLAGSGKIGVEVGVLDEAVLSGLPGLVGRSEAIPPAKSIDEEAAVSDGGGERVRFRNASSDDIFVGEVVPPGPERHTRTRTRHLAASHTYAK